MSDRHRAAYPTEPLDLDAIERRIYGPDVPYPRIVLLYVPQLLAEVRRLRAVLVMLGGPP